MSHANLFKKRKKRETIYTPEQIKEVAEFVKANSSLTWEELSKKLKLTPKTIYSWCCDHNVKKVDMRSFRYKKNK